jgi:2-haloacid dehalogenase
VFDVNETLLDLTAMDETFTDLTGDPDARREWFDLVIRTALTVTAAGSYRDFAEIAGTCAAAVLARHGHQPTDADRQAIGAALRALPAHPDVPGALHRLTTAGIRLVALTNSPLATAEAQLTHAGIRDRFDAVFSAEQAGALKPAPAAYRLVLDAYHLDPTETVMITAHDWDITGAALAGLRTGFLARPGHTLLPGTPSATFTPPIWTP